MRVIRSEGGPTWREAAESLGASSLRARAAVRPMVADSVRRIEAARYQAELDGARALASARASADAILNNAKRDAEALREQARVEGMARGEAQALAMVTAAREEQRHALDDAIPLVAAATRAVAERALGHALSLDDELLVSWAREALAPLKAARRIVIRVSARTRDRLVPLLRDVAPGASEALELLADDAIEDGVLQARSPVGDVSVDVRIQAGTLVEAIRDALAERVAGSARKVHA